MVDNWISKRVHAIVKMGRLEVKTMQEFDIIYHGRAVRVGMISLDRDYTIYNNHGNSLEVPAGKGVLAAILEAQKKEELKGNIFDENPWDYCYNVFKVEDRKEETGGRK